MVDRFTKRLIIEPTKSTATAVDTARLSFDRLPNKIISDRDPRFVSNFGRHLFKLSGTHLAPSTAYHPQTDGQSERANRTIAQLLRAYILGCEDNWDVLPTPAEFAYNSCIQPSTKQTPFFLDNGRNPTTPLFLMTQSQLPDTNPASTNFLQDITERYEQAKKSLLDLSVESIFERVVFNLNIKYVYNKYYIHYVTISYF